MSIERCELAPGYSISRILNGGWQLSAGHGRQPFERDAVIAALLRLQEAGLTTFDCADIYTGVEDLFGEMLRRYRARSGDQALEEIQIHTKCVPNLADLPSLRRRDIEAIVDRSLTRLGVDRLDLVQFHWWDYAIPGYVDAAGWLAEMQSSGKIRLLGATNFDGAHLGEIVAAGIDLAVVQVQYSLLDPRPEHGLVDFCAEHEIRMLCYGSLAGGFLAEKYRSCDDPDLVNRSLTKYRLVIEDAGGWSLFQELLEALARVANKHRALSRHPVSLSNVAVRWVLDQSGVAGAIIGARDDAHLEENLRVMSLELDVEDRHGVSQARSLLRPLMGEPFTMERVPDGRHQRIMKTGLNRTA